MKKKPKPPSKAENKAVPKISAPRNVITSYAKIDDILKLELAKKYPDGFTNYLRRYPKPNGEYFFAVPLEVDDMNYLIKVEVKIDNLITDDDFDKHFGDVSEVDSKSIGEPEIADDDDDDDDEEVADEDDDEE